LKWFAKKRKNELIAVHDNLDTFFVALSSGQKPLQLSNLGFVHIEQKGVLAIDQKGGGGNLAQTRLYVFPDERTETLHLISLKLKAGKKQQNEDVQECLKFVESLLESE